MKKIVGAAFILSPVWIMFLVIAKNQGIQVAIGTLGVVALMLIVMWIGFVIFDL